MKFYDKYPDMAPHSPEKDCIIKGDIESPCTVCSELTPFVDICYEAHFCSDECLHEFDQEMNEKCNKSEPSYPDAVDGDIYLNPFFGDMWIVDGKHFIKINDGCTIDIDEPEGFIKVGHVDGVINKKEVD